MVPRWPRREGRSAPGPPGLTLNPTPPFLQHRQASMRATREKRPEKDTATTAREDDQEGSPSGAPSAEGERSHGRAGRRLLRPPPPAPSPPAVLRAGHAPAQAPPSRTPGPASEAQPLLRDPTPAETLPGPEQVGARGGRGGRACSPVSSHWAPLCPHPEDMGLTSQLSLPTSSLWGFTDTPLQGQGLRNVGDPLQVSLRFWSPRLAPLDPATGTVIIAEATGMALGKAEIPGGPRGPGAGRGGLRSALLGGKVSWLALSVSPTPASRQLGDRAVRHKACPASEDRDPAVPGRCCVGRAVVSSSMWPGVPKSPPCRTCHQGDPLLQHLVHVSPLVANAHQMGSPRCPGQQDTAPNTYSRPSD